MSDHRNLYTVRLVIEKTDKTEPDKQIGDIIAEKLRNLGLGVLSVGSGGIMLEAEIPDLEDAFNCRIGFKDGKPQLSGEPTTARLGLDQKIHLYFPTTPEAF